jgi:transcriptional regulator of acetoin/glycerol metabolism
VTFNAEDLLHSRLSSGNSTTAALSNESVRAEIRESWQRCEELGLSPDRIPKQVNTTSQELRELLDRESFLVHLARSEFRKLQLQLPCDNCVLGFTNRDTYLIDVLCSNPAVTLAAKALPGSCWRENFRGTNAIGTASYNRAPVFIRPQDHFLRYYNALSCVAAPISDPDGEMVGVLHVASNTPVRLQHTMTLLCMSALYIESELFKDRYRSEIVLQFHSRDEFTNTLDAGLIAFDVEGTILASNRQARLFLEGLPAETGHHFDEVFRTPFRQFMSRPKTTDAVTQLVDVNGSASNVRLRVPGRRTGRGQPIAIASEVAESPDSAGGFVYADPTVSRAVSLVRHAVAKSVPILLRGETGTGKEMLAQYAHRLSGRAGRFIAINCAAFPESLIESELFGYREGSFTGARSGGAEGLILQANGGTLLLDEIGDMPMNLQPTLLRFLDDWIVRAIGSNKEVKVDIQLIAATNCDLEEAIAEKRFRRDLLHRINGVDIRLPRLCDRLDFEEIVKDILSRISPQIEIDRDALELLRQQPWTGNMRELRNFLIRSSLTCTGPRLSVEAIQPFLTTRHVNGGLGSPDSFALLDVRRRAIIDAYHFNGGNISKAAQSLSISRNTVYRELRLAGLIDNAHP